MLTLISFFGNGDVTLSNKELLAGTEKQSWTLFSTTTGRCISATDDSWIFFADGSFEFNHGTVIEDEINRCRDFINITGRWELTDNDSRLKVIVTLEKDGVANIHPLLEGRIQELNEEKLIVISTETETGAMHTFEFRRQ
jgi:hypothetical protein